MKTLDAATTRQVGLTIEEMARRIDQIAAGFETRDFAVSALPSAAFLAFVAVAMVLGKSTAEISEWLVAGHKVVDQVLASRGDNLTRFYGRGRRCFCLTSVPRSEANAAIVAQLDGAKKEIDEARLFINIALAHESLLFKQLIEYCVILRMLAPLGVTEMTSATAGMCAEAIASGTLDRNVVQVKWQ